MGRLSPAHPLTCLLREPPQKERGMHQPDNNPRIKSVDGHGRWVWERVLERGNCLPCRFYDYLVQKKKTAARSPDAVRWRNMNLTHPNCPKWCGGLRRPRCPLTAPRNASTCRRSRRRAHARERNASAQFSGRAVNL